MQSERKPPPISTGTQLAILVIGDILGATFVLAAVFTGSVALLVVGIALMAGVALVSVGSVLSRRLSGDSLARTELAQAQPSPEKRKQRTSVAPAAAELRRKGTPLVAKIVRMSAGGERV
ncbi:MAG: hypothetical protein HY332_02245 [Chloroflexi bacterium]|nr:hypothetical protein [Chloroflexota bacterium]